MEDSKAVIIISVVGMGRRQCRQSPLLYKRSTLYNVTVTQNSRPLWQLCNHTVLFNLLREVEMEDLRTMLSLIS